MTTAPDDPTGPRAAQCRVAFGVAYDGGGFRGFAIQSDEPTVAGEIIAALERVTGVSHRYTCAGRTDAGVHAHAQVMHVDLDPEVLARRYGLANLAAGTEIPELARALSRQLGPQIVIWRAVVCAPSFDARRSALSRRYRYDLLVSERPDPLLASSTWWVGPGLDLAAMRLGCDPLIGVHDFAGFCRRPPGHEGPITRRVVRAHWAILDAGRWRFEIESSSFCHQMVRSIMGSLVAIGEGKMRPSDLTVRLRSGDRSGSPAPAPARGLCLVAVTYPDECGGTWS